MALCAQMVSDTCYKTGMPRYVCSHGVAIIVRNCEETTLITRFEDGSRARRTFARMGSLICWDDDDLANWLHIMCNRGRKRHRGRGDHIDKWNICGGLIGIVAIE